MKNQQLVDYINQSLAAGQTKEHIKQSLLSAGWQERDIEENFNINKINMDKPIVRSYSKFMLAIIASMAVLILIGGGLYFSKKYYTNNREKLVEKKEDYQLNNQNKNIEKINGIIVPATPDVKINQSTLGGVDVDGNAIRDDIDRLIATEFGTNPKSYAVAVKFAATLQTAITSPTEETIARHISVITCEADSKELSSLDKITTATLDTPNRRGAYGDAFAGAVLSSEGCAQ